MIYLKKKKKMNKKRAIQILKDSADSVGYETRIFGIPITEFNKEELIIIISFLHQEHERQVQSLQQNINFFREMDGLYKDFCKKTKK